MITRINDDSLNFRTKLSKLLNPSRFMLHNEIIMKMNHFRGFTLPSLPSTFPISHKSPSPHPPGRFFATIKAHFKAANSMGTRGVVVKMRQNVIAIAFIRTANDLRGWTLFVWMTTKLKQKGSNEWRMQREMSKNRSFRSILKKVRLWRFLSLQKFEGSNPAN